MQTVEIAQGKSSGAGPGRLAMVVLSAAVFLLPLALSRGYAPSYYLLGKDSGVFLYTAERILEGGLPYVDSWDHKPPMVYLLNIAAGANRWGVFFLENLLLGASLVVLLHAGRRAMGLGPALLATVVVAAMSRIDYMYNGGNFTEGYAASFVALLLAGVVSGTRRSWVWAGMGVCAGLTFFTKESCIAAPVAVGVMVLVRALRRWNLHGRCLLAYAGGVVCTGVVFLGGLAAMGLLDEFINTNFVYTRIYLADADFGRGMSPIEKVYQALQDLEDCGMLNVTLFGLMGCGLVRLAGRALRLPLASQRLAGLLLVAIPLETFLVSMPLRFYSHYFLVDLVMIGLAIGLWVQLVLTVGRAATERLGRQPLLRAGVVAMSIVPFLTMSNTFALTWFADMAHMAMSPKQRTEDVEVLTYMAAWPAQSKALFWGEETKYNVLAGRASPSRYSFFLPLGYEAYDQSRRFGELMAGLRANPDAIIIDTLGKSPNALDRTWPAKTTRPYRISRGCLKQLPPELIGELRQYVHQHYRADKKFENGWVAYVPKNWPASQPAE